MLALLDLVAQKRKTGESLTRWTRSRDRTHFSFDTYVAQVIEASVEKKTVTFRVIAFCALSIAVASSIPHCQSAKWKAASSSAYRRTENRNSPLKSGRVHSTISTISMAAYLRNARN